MAIDNFLRIDELEKILGFPAHSKGFLLRTMNTTEVPMGTNSGYLEFTKELDKEGHSLFLAQWFISGKPLTKAVAQFQSAGTGTRLIPFATFFDLEIIECRISIADTPTVHNVLYIKLHYNKVTG
jgi:hypothetical protein